MDAGGEAFLSVGADHPRRQQEGPAQRPGDRHRAAQDQAGAGEAAGGARDGREDKRVRIPRMLGQEQGGRPRGVRDGDQSRPAGQEKEEDQMRPAIISSYSVLRHSLRS